MALDEIRATLNQLQTECSRLVDHTEQAFDELDLLVHHADLCRANATLPSPSQAELQTFLADELSRIRGLLENQGQVIHQLIRQDANVV